MTIAYDGTRYSGWQRQDGFDSIQARLEDAMAVLCGETVVVHGAGRTDTGVHALRQCAHVRLPAPRPPAELLTAVNGNLPHDIAVRAVRPVGRDFHARFSAIGKRYVYRCIVGRIRPVHGRDYYHWVRRPVDLAAMRRGAAPLVGRHDFAAFASNPGYERRRGTVRTLQRAHVVQRPHGFDLCFQGDGFLYNMVRTMAGTLIQVGQGKRSAEDVGRILASADRAQAGPNSPASGLFLQRVLYDPGSFGFEDRAPRSEKDSEE